MTTSRRTRFSKDAELTPAFILHTRKYRDTSLIAEILTERDGRVAAVIRGARDVCVCVCVLMLRTHAVCPRLYVVNLRYALMPCACTVCSYCALMLHAPHPYF